MRLEDVTAEIRPRAPWESIDLGCALARQEMGTIMKAWAVTVLPLWLLLAVVLLDHPLLFIFIVWWLKPIYDRVPLMVVSRALFGAPPSWIDVLKVWPKMIFRRLFFALLMGRFSPSRSLSLPVAELEGLRSTAYRQRVDLLERNGGEGAVLATLVGVLLEVVAGFGLVMFIMMMVPDEVSSRWSSGVGDFFTYNDVADIPNSFIWLMAGIYMVSITLMEPFYVSAGFALYINSRTLTEGWDIELAFKRMSARLKALQSKGTQLLLFFMATAGFLVAGGWLSPVSLHASPDVVTVHVGEVLCDDAPPSHPSTTSSTAKNPKQRIERIMDDEAFTIHHRFVDVPVKKEKKHSSAPPKSNHLFEDGGMKVFGNIVFYITLLLVIAGLGYLIYQNRHIFSGWGRGKREKRQPKTSSVMGMDVSPESLPDNVPDAAKSAWRDGDHHRALSLLYRGSITWFIHQGEVMIEEGDTEGDCLRRVRESVTSENSLGSLLTYFQTLTGEWVIVAYGEKVPQYTIFVELCDSWPFDLSSKKKASIAKKERRDS